MECTFGFDELAFQTQIRRICVLLIRIQDPTNVLGMTGFHSEIASSALLCICSIVDSIAWQHTARPNLSNMFTSFADFCSFHGPFCGQERLSVSNDPEL